MASIKSYETKSGLRYRVQYRDPSGTPRTKRGFTTKAQANSWAAKNTVAMDGGDWVDPKLQKVTISEVGARWLATRTHLKPSTYRVVEQDWRVHVKPAWGDRRISTIKPSEVQEWVSTMGRSASKVRAAHLCLAQVIDIAMKDGVVKVNPARGVTLPRKKKGVKIYLQASELAELADECSRHGELVWLLGTSGLRWGEAVALRPMDLDPLRKRIHITRNAVTVGSDSIIGTAKNHENRTVAVAKHIMDMLVTLSEGKKRDGLLWPREDATPMRVPGHGSFFHEAVKRMQARRLAAIDKAHEEKVEPPAPFPAVTPHGLRHVAAGLLVQSGANIKLVQRQLGHASAAMTLDVYSELFDDGLDQLVVKLDEQIKPLRDWSESS